jgi:hypothetical protein
MSDINNQITSLIQSYILTYDKFLNAVSNGETIISVSGTFTGSGQQFFTTQSENECALIIENSIKTNTNGTYDYVGAYVDIPSRYIPRYIENVDSVENAIIVARKNNATVFGIQDGGQLFINTEPLKVALTKATMGGTTSCSNELGCSWVNQVYSVQEGVYAGGTYNDGTCSLYTSGTFTSGSDSVIVDIEIYYDETLNDILDKIQTLLQENDSDLEIKYNTLMKALSTSNNIKLIEKVTAQKNQLVKFAKQNDLLNEQYNNSFDKLREENISFRIWVFIFLFVLFATFQLFKNPILKSISYVCLVFMITIIVSVIKILNPFLFMIIILFIFLSTVLTLFYKEKYPLSIGILIIGSIIFALVYRL